MSGGDRRGLRRRGWFALALLLSVFGAEARGAVATREIYGASGADLGLYLGSNLLSSWRVKEARDLLEEVVAREGASGETRLLEAHVLFFEGRYAESRALLEELGVEGPFLELVRATAEVADGFRSRVSKHFEVFWSDPRDELLVDPALEALEAARETLARDLGFEPDERVRVEIYPSVSSFTAVSTLTEQEVATSGTIGLCKFNRIMITSPRVTLWGYRWRDTLCHEYVHLAVYRDTQGLAPIWIHEGVAKYFEGAWRGVYGELEPSSQTLLARRMEEGTLISLEDMSPSVAKLPSAEDTALAFAEVGTMMVFLTERRGPDALSNLVDGVGSGLGDREALERVWGGGFEEFDSRWRAWVENLTLERDAGQVLHLELAEGLEEDAVPGEIPDPRARDFLRLGDMLRARGRERAAAAEYAKAYEAAPGAPGVASRHALGLLSQGRYGEALRVSEEALALYPDLGVLWFRKGQALLAQGRYGEALSAFSELMEINPFHSPGRRGILSAARALGDLEQVEQQEWALELLGEQPSSAHP